MATEVDWNSVGGKEGGKGAGRGKTRFIRFEPGKTVEVRPLGKAVEFYKFFIPETQRSVVVDLDDGTKAAELLTQHAGKEIKPSHRFAMNVIDRADNLVSVLEGGRSVFKYFAAWAKRAKSHPGGQNGGNWTIEATGQKLNREYTTTYIGPAPISDKERAAIEAAGGLYVLQDVFKACPLENLIERAFGAQPHGNSEPSPASDPQTSKADDDALGDVDSDPVNW